MNFNKLTLAIVLCALGQLQASSQPADAFTIVPDQVVTVERDTKKWGSTYSATLVDGTQVVAHNIGGKKVICSWVNLKTFEHGNCDESNFALLKQIYDQRQKQEKELSSNVGR